MIQMLHDLVAELSRRSPIIAAMNLPATHPDVPLENGLLNVANVPADLDRIGRAIEALVSRAGLSVADAETAVRNLLSEKNFYGQYLELGAYEWLDRHDVRFHAQEHLVGSDVLNPNGVVIDGHLDVVDGFFDIKAMGFQEWVAEQFRRRLEAMLTGLIVAIDGSMDVGVKDIETFAFRQLAALASALAAGGQHQIPQLGWTIRTEPPKRIRTTVTTTDPYALAENNRYYPFKTAGQFSRYAPFLLIFAYAAQFNSPLFTNFAASSDVTLRSLSRRAFMQFTHDATPATQFDAQVATGVRLSEASSLLSGLLFLNIDTDGGWLFLNPRATHRLTRYHVEQMFDFRLPPDLGYDDFAHDDY